MNAAVHDHRRPGQAAGLLQASPHNPGPTDAPVFVLGAPRSGTTWVAKILDSHPDVLYRHEPDIDLPPHGMPLLCGDADIPLHEAAARAHIARWIGARTLRVSGGLPIFPKRYQNTMGPPFRRACVVGLRALESVPRLGPLARRLAVPDMIDRAGPRPLRIVVKSINSLGRAGLFAAAAPQASFVLLLRHPCGHVASMLRGHVIGKFRGGEGPAAGIPEAIEHRYGIPPGQFLDLAEPVQHALYWALRNDTALEQLLGHPRLKVLRYEDLCADPIGGARSLLEFAGLDWHAQTERFLQDSTTHAGPVRYYGVFRNTAAAAEQWRRELDPGIQRAILDMMERSRAGRLAIAEVGSGAPAARAPAGPLEMSAGVA